MVGNNGTEVLDLSKIPARVISEQAHDPARNLRGAPPNLGEYNVPHMLTMQARVGTISRVYRPYDEALRDSWENARYMRNECGIMECLEGRQRGTALLKWHLVPEDEGSQDDQNLAEVLTPIVERIPQFLEYRRNLLEALWFGKYGNAHKWGRKQIRGRWRTVISGWEPRHGDKLVFRYDDGNKDFFAGQLGIRVGAGYDLDLTNRHPLTGDPRTKIQPTDLGLAYFFDTWERESMIAVHKHMIEDGAYDDPLQAGSIHGVGIRSRIYWTWYMMTETLSFLMEYLERSALGVEIWKYPASNSEAEAKTRTAAEERIGGGRSIVLMPVYQTEDAEMFDVEHIEPGMAGAESVKSLITEFFMHKIKRYILGQILTTETDSTGLGSGVADAHLSTFLDIVRYDARKLEETITDELIEPIKNYNFPAARGKRIRFVIDTEAPDMQEKLESHKMAYEMGLGIKAEDIRNLIGASEPEPDDELLKMPDQQQGGGGMFPGIGDGQMGGDSNPAEQGRDFAEDIASTIGGVLGPGEEADNYDAEEKTYTTEDRGGPDPFTWTERSEQLKYARQRGFDWHEEDHPRDESGQFADKEGGSSDSDESKSKGKGSDKTNLETSGQKKGAGGVTRKEAIEKAMEGSTRSVMNYEQSVRATYVYTGTSASEWSAVGIKEFREVSDGRGGAVSMPVFDTTGGYKQPDLVFDSEGTCGLCGHDIKHTYWIQNDGKKMIMPVGSECVTRFGEGKSGQRLEKEQKWKMNRDVLGEAWDARQKLAEYFGESYATNNTQDAESAKLFTMRKGQAKFYAKNWGVTEEQAERIVDLNSQLESALHDAKGYPILPESKRIPKFRRGESGYWTNFVNFTRYSDPASDATVTRWIKKNGDGIRDAIREIDEIVAGKKDKYGLSERYGNGQKTFWSEEDHPRDEGGLFTGKEGGDTAVTNVPVDKRGGGSLNAQIDRSKAKDAKAKKEKAKTVTAARKEARALFEEYADAIVAKTVEKHGVDAKEARKTLKGMIQSDPKLLLRMLEQERDLAEKSKGDLQKRVDDFHKEWKRKEEAKRRRQQNPDGETKALQEMGKRLRSAGPAPKARKPLSGQRAMFMRAAAEVFTVAEWPTVERYAATLADTVDEAAAQADSPSEAQAESGNYKMGHCKIQGLDITIENARGSKRNPEWPDLAHHYGYIKRTEGSDGDHVDVFLGPNPESEIVFAINQADPETGEFDELKIMLGFTNEKDAKEGYLACYGALGKSMCDDINSLTITQFKDLIEDGDTKKPIKKYSREAWKEVSPGVSNLAADEAAMHESEESSLSVVWGEGNSNLRQVAEQFSSLLR